VLNMSVNLLIFSHKITFALECHKTARHFKTIQYFLLYFCQFLYLSQNWRLGGLKN